MTRRGLLGADGLRSLLPLSKIALSVPIVDSSGLSSSSAIAIAVSVVNPSYRSMLSSVIIIGVSAVDPNYKSSSLSERIIAVSAVAPRRKCSYMFRLVIDVSGVEFSLGVYYWSVSILVFSKLISV